jgi:MarC family membrane protein
MSVVSAIFVLLFVMDPLGNVPLYLTALKDIPSARRKRIVVRESFIALAVLVFFLFVGRYFLDLLQISEPALGIAGAIVLFLISLRMVFGGTETSFASASGGEPFVVPLAVPLVAGPSTIATVLLLQGREPERVFEWLLALVAAWFLSTIVLFFASGLGRALGDRVLIALERLMGMILTAVAVQMFLTGVQRFYLTE